MILEKREKNALLIDISAVPGDVSRGEGGRESDEVSVSLARREEAAAVEQQRK